MKPQSNHSFVLLKMATGFFVLMVGSLGSGFYLIRQGLKQDQQFLSALQNKYNISINSSGIKLRMDPEQIVAHGEELQFPAHFRSLKINSHSGNYTVRPAAVSEIKVHINWAEDREADRYQDGHSLLMSETTEDEIILNEAPEVTNLEVQIEIPEGEFQQFIFKTASGDLSIEKMELKSLEVSTDSGEVHLSQIQAKNVEVRTSSGDLNLYGGIIEELKFKSASGDAQLEAKAPFSVNFESVSGDLKALFDNSLPVHARLKTISGEIENGFPQKEDSKIRIYGTTVSGSMRLLSPKSP